VVDRRGSPSAARRNVRAVVDFLRTRAKETGACRVAIVRDDLEAAELCWLPRNEAAGKPRGRCRADIYIFVSLSAATYDVVRYRRRDRAERLTRAGFGYGDV